MASMRRGLAGLDALILFIALMLVASVVGLAIMSTHSALVNRGKAVESEKSKEIQRPILVESLRGIDTDNDDRLNELIFAVHLRGGDKAISFNTTVILVNTKALN